MHTSPINFSSVPMPLVVAFAAVVASACSSSIAAPPRNAPGGFDLRRTEAFGVPQHPARAATPPADISAYLVDNAPAAKSTAHETPAPKQRITQQRLARTVAPTAHPVVETPTPLPLADHTAVSAPATTDVDAERYAARDQQAKKQKVYRGGDAIVITSGAIVLALLIVLLVLLLT